MTALPTTAGSLPARDADGRLRPANAGNIQPPANEFLYAAPASGFGDDTVHSNPVATCARCHGSDGSGAVTGGEAPNLTIQDAPYLQAALEAYTQGSRKSGFMQNIASQLSEAQIAALSRYYAGLPTQANAPHPADPILIKRGETIALQGLPASATPACASCHESAGSRITGAPHVARRRTVRDLSASLARSDGAGGGGASGDF